jgi:hypothetical protein
LERTSAQSVREHIYLALGKKSLSKVESILTDANISIYFPMDGFAERCKNAPVSLAICLSVCPPVRRNVTARKYLNGI